MAIVTYQYVVTRPDTTQLFGDWTGDLAAYASAYNDLPINAITIMSADGLTRTRTETYDDSIQPQITALQTQYAAALQTEGTRRTAASFTMTTTTLTAPPAAIDPSIV